MQKRDSARRHASPAIGDKRGPNLNPGAIASAVQPSSCGTSASANGDKGMAPIRLRGCERARSHSPMQEWSRASAPLTDPSRPWRDLPADSLACRRHRANRTGADRLQLSASDWNVDVLGFVIRVRTHPGCNAKDMR